MRSCYRILRYRSPETRNQKPCTEEAAMGNLIQDLRYAARTMLKQKGFTVVAVAALALGIGANTAIFTVVNAVVLRPLPYDDPDRLVWLWDTQPQLATAPASLPDFIDWRDQNQSFEYLAAYQSGDMFVDDGNGAQDTKVGLVTPDLFSLFREKPLLGRTFTEEETQPGRFRVAVLSQNMWQRRFGSDPNVLGQTKRSAGGVGRQSVGVLEYRDDSSRSRNCHRCSRGMLHTVDLSADRRCVRSHTCV